MTNVLSKMKKSQTLLVTDTSFCHIEKIAEMVT